MSNTRPSNDTMEYTTARTHFDNNSDDSFYNSDT